MQCGRGDQLARGVDNGAILFGDRLFRHGVRFLCGRRRAMWFPPLGRWEEDIHGTRFGRKYAAHSVKTLVRQVNLNAVRFVNRQRRTNTRNLNLNAFAVDHG